MACDKNCKKGEAQIKDTQPVESVAVTEQEAEQVTGGVVIVADNQTGGNSVVVL